MTNETVTLNCRHCGAKNRIPVEKALRDLSKPRCGSCKAGLLRVNGESLVEVDRADLAHPWDQQALEKFRAVPLADKIVSKVFAATLDKLSRFYHLASAVRVNERQAPRLWRLYLEAAGRINVDPPPLFIRQSPVMNAYAAGAGDHFVTVTSGLLDGMGDREIVGVLGHELTHIKLDHVLYQVVARLLLAGGMGILKYLGIAGFLAIPIRMALVRWYQMAELSGDRGELLATGSLETFIRAHMLLAGGATSYIEELDVAAFVDQAHEAEQMRDGDILVYVMELLEGSTARTHPLPAWRVHHGLKWARSKRFFEILAGRNNEKIEQE